MHSRTALWTALLLSLGLLTTNVRADSLEFASPAPDAKFSQGEVVPVSFKVHHNGMSKLLWAKVHLMTEDGYDAGTGTLSTTSRPEWQASMAVSSGLQIPADMTPGKYILHVYGSTEEPCQDAVDISKRCEGILSEMLPLEIIEAGRATPPTSEASPPPAAAPATTKTLLSIHLGPKITKTLSKRGLYSSRDLGIAHSDYVLKDGTPDHKKMLYMYSLI